MNKACLLVTLAGLSLVTPAVHAATSTPGKPQVVQVKLSEWTMGLGTMTVKGVVQFEVTNAGKYPHGFAVEGQIGGKDFEISTGWLKPGEKTTLLVELPAGKYNSYCPVPGHEDKGMKSGLTFQ